MLVQMVDFGTGQIIKECDAHELSSYLGKDVNTIMTKARMDKKMRDEGIHHVPTSGYYLYRIDKPRESNAVNKEEIFACFEAGMKRKDIADKLGISKSSITRWKGIYKEEKKQFADIAEMDELDKLIFAIKWKAATLTLKTGRNVFAASFVPAKPAVQRKAE